MMQAVAEGSQDRLVTEADGATALAFTPDDRLLVTARDGRVRVSKPGSTDTTEAMDISGRVCSNSERGLLGLAVDPDFGTNHFVYLYYNHNKFNTCPTGHPEQNNNPVNRVSRFVMSGDTINPASQDVLIDNIPSPNGNHNAGDLHFGKDGYLYVSVGDGGCDYAEPTKCQPENDASRAKHVLLGKILRINADGTIPADNLYANGTKFRTPLTLLSWEGYNLNVYAPPQKREGRRYVFRAWSNGRGARHTIVTPENSTTYVATFRLRRR